MVFYSAIKLLLLINVKINNMLCLFKIINKFNSTEVPKLCAAVCCQGSRDCASLPTMLSGLKINNDILR